uniref:Uncharacterized protein n=1 Tax=Oryza barthii TaxID=65489 RepID=A0A0D3H9N6_9ORYZ
MELKNAFSTSTEAFLLSKHITYSITMASHGNVIFPSLVKPNSSCDILRSSPKTIVPRYRSGTSNRMPSAVAEAGNLYLSCSALFVDEVMRQDVSIELSNAFTTSAEAFLLSKHMAYSISAASQGSMILPSLVKPNSSWDILRSSMKTLMPRYTNGTSNRLPSAVYMTQWPLTATEVEHSSSTTTGEDLWLFFGKLQAGNLLVDSTTSKGNTILPSLVKPNSSWDILRSSLKTAVPRYVNGTSNRLPSAVYMTQWPLTATEVEHSSGKPYGSSSGSYKQEICWLTPTVGTILPVQWQRISIELSNASTTSTDGFLLSKHMAYSISAASQGNTILPSLVKPNSSWDILRSSLKTTVPRYANGTSNRLLSAVYMTQWPLTATEVEHSSVSWAFPMILFLPRAAILCHFAN